MKQMSSNGSGGARATVFYSVPGNGDSPIMTLACSAEVRMGEDIGASSEEMIAHGHGE